MTALLTPKEVVRRWAQKGMTIKIDTLAKWRAEPGKRGPPFKRIGKAIYYPLEELEGWEAAQVHRRLTG